MASLHVTLLAPNAIRTYIAFCKCPYSLDRTCITSRRLLRQPAHTAPFVRPTDRGPKSKFYGRIKYSILVEVGSVPSVIGVLTTYYVPY